MTISPRGLGMLRNVEVCLSVELGRARMTLKDLMALENESIVPLDRLSDEPLDVFVNGKRIAKAEILTEGDRFALRIVEMDGEAEDDTDQEAEPDSKAA